MASTAYALLGPLPSGAETRAFLGCRVEGGLPRPEQPIVVIWLPEDTTKDAKLVERLQRETAIVRELAHKNVIRVHGLERFEGGWARLVDFADAEPLSHLLELASERGQSISIKLAAKIVSDVCSGVQFAQDHGARGVLNRPIVHGAIRPDTILVGFNGRAMITGYGASVLAASRPRSGDLRACYLAPEQIIGGKATASVATDIYGLGAVLYHLIAGEPPFADAADVHSAILTETPRPIGLSGPAGALEAIAARAMSRRGIDRYGSPAELLGDVMEAVGSVATDAALAGFLDVLVPRESAERSARSQLLEEARSGSYTILNPADPDDKAGAPRKADDTDKPRPVRKAVEREITVREPAPEAKTAFDQPFAQDDLDEALGSFAEAPDESTDAGEPRTAVGSSDSVTASEPRVPERRMASAAEALASAAAALAKVRSPADPAERAAAPVQPSSRGISDLELEPGFGEERTSGRLPPQAQKPEPTRDPKRAFLETDRIARIPVMSSSQDARSSPEPYGSDRAETIAREPLSRNVPDASAPDEAPFEFAPLTRGAAQISPGAPTLAPARPSEPVAPRLSAPPPPGFSPALPVPSALPAPFPQAPPAGSPSGVPYPAQATYPQGAYPPGAYPPGAYPPGAYPPGAYPPGAYPPGAYPPGAYPPGSYPYSQPGGYAPPQGAYPPGTYPPGFAPGDFQSTGEVPRFSPPPGTGEFARFPGTGEFPRLPGSPTGEFARVPPPPSAEYVRLAPTGEMPRLVPQPPFPGAAPYPPPPGYPAPGNYLPPPGPSASLRPSAPPPPRRSAPPMRLPAPVPDGDVVDDPSDVSQIRRDGSRFLLLAAIGLTVGLIGAVLAFSKDPPKGLTDEPEHRPIPKEMLEEAMRRADQKKEEPEVATEVTTAADAGTAPQSPARPGAGEVAPVPQGLGKLTLDSNPPLDVYEAAKSLGRTPLTVSLRAGKHQIRFTDKEKLINTYRTYKVVAGTEQRDNVQLGKSELRLEAPPGSLVRLNGRTLGKAPIDPQSLYEGSYVVEVTHNGQTWTERFDAPPGQKISFKVRF